MSVCYPVTINAQSINAQPIKVQSAYTGQPSCSVYADWDHADCEHGLGLPIVARQTVLRDQDAFLRVPAVLAKRARNFSTRPVSTMRVCAPV